MTTIESRLGIEWEGERAARLALGRELHGAFGGAFGGLLAASAVFLARSVAPERTPAGIDCRFLRGLAASAARCTIDVLHAGRSLTCVRVDVHDDAGRTATTATVSLVEPAALHPLDVTPDGRALPTPSSWRDWKGPPGVEIPIVHVLEPSLALLDSNAIASSVRLPWDDDDGEYSAEAACVAGDFCVGPPVANACDGAWLPHPNPDLSLRFTPLTKAQGFGSHVVGVGRVVRIVGGLALIDIDVQAAGTSYAAGSATSMVLRGAEG